MDTRASRAADYRYRLTHDIDRMLAEYGVTPLSMFSAEQYMALVEELVDCAMHHIEHLLLEVTR